MTKLKIPTLELVKKYLIVEKGVDERQSAAAAALFLEAYQKPFEPKANPIVDVISPDAVIMLQNATLAMIEQGVEPSLRRQKIAASLQEQLQRAFESEIESAIAVEQQLIDLTARKAFSPDDRAAALKTAQTLPGFAKLKKISIWLNLANTHYSSIRSGSDHGSSGSGLKKHCSTLRVAATTIGDNLSVKLFWALPWGSGSTTIFSKSVIEILVVASHWRGCLLGIIPQGSANLIAGSKRNGTDFHAGPSSGSVLVHNHVWIDSDPNLTNLTFYGNSNWSSVPLSVTGAV